MHTKHIRTIAFHGTVKSVDFALGCDRFFGPRFLNNGNSDTAVEPYIFGRPALDQLFLIIFFSVGIGNLPVLEKLGVEH